MVRGKIDFLRRLAALYLAILLSPHAYANDKDSVADHHAGVFLGTTTVNDSGESSFTAGIDYEYRFDFWGRRLGLLTLADLTVASPMTVVLAGGLAIHPWNEIKLWAAPGYEYVASSGTHASEKSFLTRLGIGYEFHIFGWSASPAFNVDLVKGHIAYIYGLNIGMPF